MWVYAMLLDHALNLPKVLSNQLYIVCILSLCCQRLWLSFEEV